MSASCSQDADGCTEGNHLPSPGVIPQSASYTCNLTSPLLYNDRENARNLKTCPDVSIKSYRNYSSTQERIPAPEPAYSEDETTPCLSVNSDAPLQNPEIGVDHRPLALVSVMVMFDVCATCLNSLIMDQYLYQHFATIAFGNSSIDTSSQPCVNTSKIDSRADMIQTVQKQASGMSLNLYTTTYCIGILSNMLLGTFSSVMSRKLLLLIPSTGLLVKCSLMPVIVYWNLDILWFYLGFGIDGVCGSSSGILLGTFLYTSDVTPRNGKRTLGVTIVETVKGAVGSAFYVVTGALIESTGYIIPACTGAGMQLLAVLVVCILPDRKPTLSHKQLHDLRSAKGAVLHMFSPFHAPKDRRVKHMISLAAFAFFLTILVRLGIEKVQNLYVMNIPFCFDAITLGWFLFIRDLVQHAFMMLTVIVLFKRLPGMLLGLAGALSMVAYSVMYSFAEVKWEILYLVPCLGLAQNLPFSIIRGETSRLLGPVYQGPLFASLAVFESVGYAAGPSTFLGIYNKTLDEFPGLVFLIGAGAMLVTFAVMCIYHRLWVAHIRSIQYKALIISPPTSDKPSE